MMGSISEIDKSLFFLKIDFTLRATVGESEVTDQLFFWGISAAILFELNIILKIHTQHIVAINKAGPIERCLVIEIPVFI